MFWTEFDMNTEIIIGFLFTPVKAFSALTILKQKKWNLFLCDSVGLLMTIKKFPVL